MKKTDQLLEEIRETNLTYLILAQKMIRADRVQALFR
ncbi:MAG TPA: flagellar transcriptional regulator FlhD, partial [Burkholderiales bacterium]|nr:flagellar transcriptional regulator FlhD [Burkholderiales bacterium]